MSDHHEREYTIQHDDGRIETVVFGDETARRRSDIELSIYQAIACTFCGGLIPALFYEFSDIRMDVVGRILVVIGGIAGFYFRRSFGKILGYGFLITMILTGLGTFFGALFNWIFFG